MCFQTNPFPAGAAFFRKGTVFLAPVFFKRARLTETLLAARTGIPALERLCADPERDILFDRSDWVSAYLDRGNTVSIDGGRLMATRAITTQGRMIWLVRSRHLSRAYHSRMADPHAAMTEAERAWQRRRDMRAHRDELGKIVHALRWGRLRYKIRVDDAYASPLCEEGVDGFLRVVGFGAITTFPGWFIAWCFAIDRQVGFVIWEAHQRHLRQIGHDPTDIQPGPTH